MNVMTTSWSYVKDVRVECSYSVEASGSEGTAVGTAAAASSAEIRASKLFIEVRVLALRLLWGASRRGD